MPCEKFTTKDGATIIACSRGKSLGACSCGARAEYLCDYPLKGSKRGQTCDRPLCRRCAKLIKHDTHYCPVHARRAEEQG